MATQFDEYSRGDPFIHAADQGNNSAEYKRHWSPYSWHGGTCLAIAGDDFVLMASDTRLGEHGGIYTRELNRNSKVTDHCAIGQCGFQGDARVLLQNVKAKIRIYEHQHMEQPTAPAIAAMLSTMLYYKRFFPYYVYNIVAGLDGEGKGSVFSYDPVGSYDQVPMVCYGSAQNLIQPFLDNQIRRPHIKEDEAPKMTRERVRQLAIDAFISASERETNTGDGITVTLIDKNGTTVETIPLRRD
ncbi:Oidioi.mRNA.OKI2018_I69.chr1.g2590.t1.cds [Oikopleura dioica]|uniref:Proteasome subunit beta n=1 Tax=Oikopleura dioica TaxID=34765 RepID=A0ABN7SRK2_OIKDI|nr:Oidioi.mRNA.OKI2018_I69.chr1.g2590.t1.cds [Oikopleura dioica]